MGNMMEVVTGSGWTMMTRNTEQEVVQEDLLLQELSEMSKVELWRVHWGLSQNLQENIPPVPPRWLWSADACSTAKIMQRCFGEEGALMVLAAVLTMIGQDSRVHHLHHAIKLPRPIMTPKPDADFVKTQRRRLISRMQHPDAILELLQDYDILNNTNREAISMYAARRDKTKALLDLVLWKGDKAQEVFYEALSHSEPFLLQALKENPLGDKNRSETCILTDMLDFLVSDELRCFQWLVRNHMTKESSAPFGGEQLEYADRLTTQRILGKYFGPKQAETIAMKVLLRIVPVLSVCLPGEVVISHSSSDIRVDADVMPVEVIPEVHKDGNMFRVHCRQPGISCCRLTGLILEGFGDVVYQMVPWDVDFLSSKGLRPAGPLFRFTLLTGSFHRLHLPHCQLFPDSGQHFLSVAHISEDQVDFISPVQITDSHVVVEVSGFSCFGLVTSVASSTAISGLVLLFTQPTDSSLFVVLLPRNVSIAQVIKEWKRRIGAEYVEAIPDCELIPNQTYKLSGQPVAVIQPKTSKFVNFTDYSNFLPSFQVQLPVDTSTVELQLSSRVTPLRLIGWLFGSTESIVWSRVVQLRAAASALFTEVCAAESVDVSLLLIHLLNSIDSEDLKTFQHLLSLQSDPIPVSRLEAADRTRTVDLMVQQYHAEGAKEVTIEILKKMKYNQLADQLQRS